MIRAIVTWWRRQQLVDAVVKTLEQGAGVSEARWECETDVATVLGWFDAQLNVMRRPYGFQACVLAIAPLEAAAANRQYVIGRTALWENEVREQVAADIAPLLATGALKTAVIALGSATSAALAGGNMLHASAAANSEQ